MARTLRLILGDQLNINHSWFREVNDDVMYCMFEMKQETDYVNHHIQKVVVFFLAMRSFSEKLKSKGHQVIYYELDDGRNSQSLENNILKLIQENNFTNFEYLLPDEYRLDEQLKNICNQLSITNLAIDTEHFLTQRNELELFFKNKKTYIMESFYRSMRKKFNILMKEGKPEGGKWNYDKENRKKIPKEHIPVNPLIFEKNVSEIIDLIKKENINTIGNVNPEKFIWPSTRGESLSLLDFFIENCLKYFGDFQDAMTPHYWSLYHSRISFSMNVKLISPLEVVRKVIHYWELNKGEISISQVEGFVRQIIGWREYMRGIYWAKMPEYSELNYFGNKNKLPSWYWTGETKMKCMSHSIQQSLDYAYAHHIQRLMVTGNFALLAGVHPDEVDDWYLGIYIDALEWVEITNTRGMSQFADGGIVGTKPYVSSATYIDKMSHYCKNCYYNKKEKVGDRACPFNSLYWDFYDRNRPLLEKNPRIGMMYRVWDKMSSEHKTNLLEQAGKYLDMVDEL